MAQVGSCGVEDVQHKHAEHLHVAEEGAHLSTAYCDLSIYLDLSSYFSIHLESERESEKERERKRERSARNREWGGIELERE